MDQPKATVVLSGEKQIVRTQNSEYVFHISSYTTNGKLSIYEATFRTPGKNKNLHYHKIITETFTVLEGEFYFNLADEEMVLKPGDSLVVPPTVIHGFRAKLPGSKLLIGFTDSPERDDFFVKLAQIVNGELVLNEKEKEGFYNSYDQYYPV
ncbi:cupin domain-containing protein [Pseudoflavitalea sp. G-6-1-2]|uniref:cupin domain-containing protein n=1 Tax=Pseudoflavitalea sp. G-6-1-2 TaxID=2728841 RepID=UPI00146DA471|nr:cupin domain-containing protein [Pseudoflavitalea sp. G-6-1-2]NML23460.1 cupin domain-containing protein [Pseudoflavitalea sp. G-6-1-2]